MTSNLAYGELYKYNWRIEKFLEKYKAEEPFELIDGSSVILSYSDNVYSIISDRKRDRITLLNKEGKSFSLSDLKKTREFGGKEKGFTTRIETREIESLNKQLNEIKNETLVLSVPLKIASNTYDVCLCSNISGTPKADFQLSNKDGNVVVWISHKDGKKPTDFQQYSGLTETEIKIHPETQTYIDDLKLQFPTGIEKAKNIVREIGDTILQNKAVYGRDYNEKEFGINNVTCLIQGEILLQRHDNCYIMSANHVHPNGDVLKDGFEPIFSTVYRTDRSQFGVPNSRFFISPKEGRRITSYI